MNIIYSCPGPMLQVYYDLHLELSKHMEIKKVAFYVSDKRFFIQFSKKYPKFRSEYTYLPEWELLDQVSDSYDISALEEYEQKYFKDYSMWYGMIADRRIFLGKYTKVAQDHTPSYSHARMMSLLQISIQKFEQFLEEVNPDYVVGHSSATFGDHILYAMAAKRNAPFMNLRHTKIKNNMTFTVGLDEAYAHVKDRCQQLANSEIVADDRLMREAESYIAQAQKGKIEYSGHRKFEMKWQSLLPGMVKSGLQALLVDLKYIGKEKDHHSNVLKTQLFFYDKPFRVFRLFYQEKKFNKIYKYHEDLSKKKYIFFPLHAEPEVSLSVLAKQYQNQIEVVRNIAMQIPIGFKLLVKDHPRNLGRRSTKYLDKLIEIPNVDVVHPSVNSLDIIKSCDMTIILSGFVGFEAVIQKKPVITLGKTMLSLLAGSMVRHVDNIANLRAELIYLLENYQYDETRLKNYLYSILSQSVSIDLMTVLLRKKGRTGRKYTESLYEENINNLADNLLQRINA